MADVTMNQTCWQPNAVPIPIQDAASWMAEGCSLGFLCQNNTIDHLPQYCPPVADCQTSRLGGGTCASPMGILEPIVCESGFYCPPGGKEQIRCPQDHFCPQGSYEATKCTIGSNCVEGSQRDMTFLPLLVLAIVDALLVSAVIIVKIRDRYKRRSHSVGKKRYTKKEAHAIGAGRFHVRQYQQVDDDQESPTGSPGHMEMEHRISPMMIRRTTGFEELGAMDLEFSVREELSYNQGGQESDLQLFVQSLSKCLGATKFGLNFEFENLTFHPSGLIKPILSKVSGMIDSGSLWGVMATFVNVLMGKATNTGGITKVNGVAGRISKYKKIIGYVPQDDIVLPELTVRGNILHSARIRLPANWSDKDIQNHVDILISCLQLSHVKDSLVGSTSAPVISGGQRKRVSIGMELAAAPMALFLDEPTSGLDATAAASIMSTLKALSRLGMTIVTIIHQPREEIFESLDSLVLLGAGRMIYTGRQENIQPHFENLGYQFPGKCNPADVMGDIIAGEGRLYKATGDASVQILIHHWAGRQNDPASAHHRKSPVLSISETSSLSSTVKIRGAYWYKQTYLCFMRSLVQQYRLKSSFFFELGVGAMAGFLIGLAEENQKGENFRGIFHPPYDLLSSSIDFDSVPQMALLVGLAIGLTASAPGVKIFGEEKLVFWREAAAGHNRLAYYMGKVASTIPRMILANFHFTTLFMLLSTPRISYISAFIANLLYFYCIYGLASIISMLTRREDGPLLAVMSSLIVGVLNGMSPSLNKVRDWHMAWLWRASPGTWLAEAYFSENVEPLRYLYDIELAQKRTGYGLGDYQSDLLMMFMLGTVYRMVAFVGLRFMYRHKQR